MTSLKIEDLQRDAREEGYTEGREEGISVGIEQGAYKKALETARTFLSMGLPLEQVAQGTGLPIETVQELTKK